MDSTNLKDAALQKIILQKIKRQTTGWEKIFADGSPIKDLYLEYIKNSHNSIKKKKHLKKNEPKI